MPPLPLEHRPRQQPGASVLVRYFMIPCNICLILLATSTLGFAVLLFLSNCTWLLVYLTEPLISVTKGFGKAASNQSPGLLRKGGFSLWVLNRSYQIPGL